MKHLFLAITLSLASLIALTYWSNRILPPNTTVLFTSFGGRDDQGNLTGEWASYMSHLVNANNITSTYPNCEQVYSGQIYHQSVLVVVSGMAKVKSSTCLTSILSKSGPKIKEIIVSGIAGFTPTQGGMLTSTGKMRFDNPVMLGDICIGSLAIDMDQQHFSPPANFWFSEDQTLPVGVKGSDKLSQDLVAASGQITWESTPISTLQINQSYHQSTRDPKVWGPSKCIEASSDLFWHQEMFDSRARKLAADWYNYTQNSSISESDIIVASAMETVAAGQVVESWNQKNSTQIAFAFIRGASNFDHPQLSADGKQLQTAQESLIKNRNLETDNYAILNSTLPVLRLLEQRSK